MRNPEQIQAEIEALERLLAKHNLSTDVSDAITLQLAVVDRMMQADEVKEYLQGDDKKYLPAALQASEWVRGYSADAPSDMWVIE